MLVSVSNINACNKHIPKSQWLTIVEGLFLITQKSNTMFLGSLQSGIRYVHLETLLPLS